MLEGLKREWRQFRNARPGARFVEYHERAKQHRGPASVLRMGLGLVLTIAGIVMLVIPGPGILFIFFGLALLAARSRGLARLLDKAELGLRKVLGWAKRAWKSAPWPINVAVVLLAAGAAVGVGAIVWRWVV